VTRASVLAAIAGAALLGCSSNSSATGGAALDGAAGDALADATQPPHDASAGPDADAGPAGPDAEIDGACEPVKGACSLVLQNCAPGQQCTVGANDLTACGPTDPAQHIAKGYPCCPPAGTGAKDPCLPGLVCAGDSCVGDAGGGRCSPYCCAGDDTPCGTSPEGFPGHCDETVEDTATGTPLYDICEYAPPCKPLGILPCPAGYACLVDDTSGGAKCTEIFNGGAPAGQEGQPCMYRNSCADGLMCLQRTFPDGAAGVQECILLCSTGKGSPPFDAGALDGGPGSGGCDQGKTCTGVANLFPPWLGVCL
jgi:hypothetical protein